MKHMKFGILVLSTALFLGLTPSINGGIGYQQNTSLNVSKEGETPSIQQIKDITTAGETYTIQGYVGAIGDDVMIIDDGTKYGLPVYGVEIVKGRTVGEHVEVKGTAVKLMNRFAFCEDAVAGDIKLTSDKSPDEWSIALNVGEVANLSTVVTPSDSKGDVSYTLGSNDGLLKLEGNKLTALKVGYSSIKATITSKYGSLDSNQLNIRISEKSSSSQKAKQEKVAETPRTKLTVKKLDDTTKIFNSTQLVRYTVSEDSWFGSGLNGVVKYRYNAVCEIDGDKTKLTFQDYGERPIYVKNSTVNGVTLEEGKVYDVEGYHLYATRTMLPSGGVGEISAAFLYSSFKEVGYTGSHVNTDVSNIKYDDANLVVENGLKVAKVNSNFSNFYFNNSEVERVEIGKDVTSISAFSFSSARFLKEIIVDKDNTKYTNSTQLVEGATINDGVLYEKDTNGNPITLVYYPTNKQELSYTTPSTVTRIGTYGVARQRYLQNLTLTDSVARLEDYCFFNSISIANWSLSANINPEDFENSSVFSGGSKITSVKIFNKDTYSKMGNIGYNITKVEFADGITELNYKDLTSFPRVQELIIPKTVNKIEFAHPTIDTSTGHEGETYYKFAFCESLDSLCKITIAEDNPTYGGDGYTIYEKSNGTLKASAANMVDSFLGRENYYEFEDAIKVLDYKSVTFKKVKTLKITKNIQTITKGFLYEDMYTASALETISVDKENTKFTSYDGVLFDKKMERMIKFPTKLKLSAIFTGQATYPRAKKEIAEEGTEEAKLRYFNTCYIIPPSVKSIDPYCFSRNVTETEYKEEGMVKTGLAYLYFPGFAYNEATDGKVKNYINNHVMKTEQDNYDHQTNNYNSFEMPDFVAYFPTLNYDHYLYKYDANNVKDKTSARSDFLTYSGGLGAEYAEKYSTTGTSSEIDSFYSRYSKYGTDGYVK